MKVLMINSVCGIRSTGRICTDLADVLVENGHECKIAYGRETVPEKYKDIAVRIGSDFDVKLHGLKSRLFDMHGFGSKKATQKFVEWVKEYDPDVIHLHNIHGYYINIEVLFDYLKTCGKKIIWTLHDCWAFTGHCSHFASASCERWKEKCFSCPKRKAYPSSILFDCSTSNFMTKKRLFTSLSNLTIITPSQWLANLVKQSFLGKYPVAVINNGIDVEVFKPTESDFKKNHGLEHKKIVLGVASSWGINKGLLDFVKLANILDDYYRIVLVGLSEKQKKKMPQNIICISKTNNTKELAAVYTAADVFANPTYCDTYPTVNLEAQACGTPVITYNTGGSVESVLRENVVEQGDIDGLKVKICSNDIKINPTLMLDKQDMLEKYFKLYVAD